MVSRIRVEEKPPKRGCSSVSKDPESLRAVRAEVIIVLASWSHWGQSEEQFCSCAGVLASLKGRAPVTPPRFSGKTHDKICLLEFHHKAVAF